MNRESTSDADHSRPVAASGDAQPRSNLYGRQRGRKLRTHQSALMESLLPKLQLDLSQPIADAASWFDNLAVSEIRLEIGFGGGEHLIGEALRHPDVGFLGCEPFVNGIAKTLCAIDEQRIANIRLHAGDARDLIAVLPSCSIAQIDLLFPDPWPKRRQRKRRFLSNATVPALARVMREGAELRFATDIDDYAGWALSHVARCADFAWTAETAGDWLSPWAAWSGTRYEARAIRDGRPPVYLTFVKRAPDALAASR
jgi:tRNA (guanine-N7-)-methyltransferase